VLLHIVTAGRIAGFEPVVGVLGRLLSVAMALTLVIIALMVAVMAAFTSILTTVTTSVVVVVVPRARAVVVVSAPVMVIRAPLVGTSHHRDRLTGCQQPGQSAGHGDSHILPVLTYGSYHRNPQIRTLGRITPSRSLPVRAARHVPAACVASPAG